jgi:hypothetical protein
MMRVLTLLATGLVLAAMTGLSTSGKDRPRHATGAEEVDPAVYAKLPRVQRHRAFLEPKVDLSSRFPPVGDQEWQSSCVAWATGYAARSFIGATQDGVRPDKADEQVSPAYIFYRVRDRKDRCVGTGSNVKAALDLLTNEGAVSLAEMPYGTAQCHIAPTDKEISAAGKWKISGWRTIQREKPDDWQTPIVLDDVKAQLQAGLPVVFTMPVTKVFDDWKGDGVYASDDKTGPLHAMTLVGYDESKQAFRVINSWGIYWGDKGYAWIDYGAFARLVREAYVMMAPQAGPPPGTPPAPALSVDQQLTKVVSGLDCGRTTLRTEGVQRIVEGFTGTKGDEARDRALSLDPNLKWNVAFRPWPQCEAQLTLAQPLLDAGTHISVRREDGSPLPGDVAALKADDIFSIDVSTTAAKPYLHVIYLQADGSAVELYRGLVTPKADGSYAVSLGAAGKKAQRYQVAGPFGDEVIIAIASTGPTFGPDLADSHTERQFLTLLRTQLAAAQREGRPVSAALQRMTTSPG